jgi:hypothetical protein
MKKWTNKILLTLFILLLMFVTVMVILVRVKTDQAMKADGLQETEAGKHLSFRATGQPRSVTLDEINGVDILGDWRVRIKPAAQSQLTAEVSDEVWENLDFEVQDGILIIRLQAEEQASGNRSYLEIEMPTLKVLTVKGRTDLTFTDFESPSLQLFADGRASIRGTSCQVETLETTATGEAELDLQHCRTTNAEVHLTASAELKLNLQGGYLKGQVADKARLDYRGSFSENSLTISQDGIVEQR